MWWSKSEKESLLSCLQAMSQAITRLSANLELLKVRVDKLEATSDTCKPWKKGEDAMDEAIVWHSIAAEDLYAVAPYLFTFTREGAVRRVYIEPGFFSPQREYVGFIPDPVEPELPQSKVSVALFGRV